MRIAVRRWMLKGAQLALFGQQQVRVRPHVRQTKRGAVPVKGHEATRAKAAPRDTRKPWELSLEELYQAAHADVQRARDRIMDRALDAFEFPKKGAAKKEAYPSFNPNEATGDYTGRKPRMIPAAEVAFISDAERSIFRRYTMAATNERHARLMMNRLRELEVGKLYTGDALRLDDAAFRMVSWADRRWQEIAKEEITVDNAPAWADFDDNQVGPDGTLTAHGVLDNAYSAPPAVRARWKLQAYTELTALPDTELRDLVVAEMAAMGKESWTWRERAKVWPTLWAEHGPKMHAFLAAARAEAQADVDQYEAQIDAAHLRGDTWVTGPARTWSASLWHRRLDAFRQLVFNRTPDEQVLPNWSPGDDEWSTPWRALEDQADLLAFVRGQGGELRGTHWGTVSPDNPMAAGLCLVSGTGIMRPAADFDDPVDMRKRNVPTAWLYAAKARRAYAQKQLAKVGGDMPEVYRGMAVPPSVHAMFAEAARSTATVPLTGCTAVAPDRKTAEHYSTSEWTKEAAAPGSKPLLMTFAFSKAMKDTVGMWHNDLNHPGRPYELLIGAPQVEVWRYDPPSNGRPAHVYVRMPQQDTASQRRRR